MAKAKITESEIPTEPSQRRAWIRLALARNGYTLKTLSRRKRCSYSMLRQAISLRRPKAQKIIAGAIGIDAEKIWPERYSNKSKEAA